MKQVYCSVCGMKLQVYQKALPQFSRVIEVIHPHECIPLEDVKIEWDLTPFPMPANIASLKGDKFIEKLDETTPIKEPGDRRAPEHVKGGNPYDDVRARVLGNALPTQPAHEPNEELEDE